MRFVAWMLVLAACDPLPPTGDPLTPVRPATVPVSQTGPSPGAPSPSAAEPEQDEVDPGGFDFEEDEGTDIPIDDLPDDPAVLLALSQGKEPPPSMGSAPVPEPSAAPSVAPVQAPAWDPASSGPAEWGVHLVSTVADVQPPMAVVGLPDGSTVVVRPGSFLPEQRVVVMAIGRDAVQIARIVPDGYQARVEARTLTSLFPAGAPRPSEP